MDYYERQALQIRGYKKEIKELVKYLEALNTLLEKYERGYV